MKKDQEFYYFPNFYKHRYQEDSITIDDIFLIKGIILSKKKSTYSTKYEVLILESNDPNYWINEKYTLKIDFNTENFFIINDDLIKFKNSIDSWTNNELFFKMLKFQQGDDYDGFFTSEGSFCKQYSVLKFTELNKQIFI